MSDETHTIGFGNARYGGGYTKLSVIFAGGDNFENATVQFKLTSVTHGTLNESAAIPVIALFDMAYLIGIAARRTALQYETEVLEMQARIAQKKHPFKHIGGTDGAKKDKEER